MIIISSTKGYVGLKYVNRGDVAEPDFDIEDLIVDGAYHDLDLPSFVPLSAKLVQLLLLARGSTQNESLVIRPAGYTLGYYRFCIKTWLTNTDNEDQCLVPLVDGRKIKYLVTTAINVKAEITVLSWLI